jgi:hypothetical protein
MKLIYALCGLLLANAVWAVPDVAVDGVRMPAWLERGTQRVPLAVGMELGNGDVLLTGQGSRVLLKTADGSDIRLGADGRFELSGVSQSHDAHPEFKATLHAVKGAFRLTTAQHGKPHARELMLQVAGVTATTPGADVWGNTEGEDSGMVLLLAGKVAVVHGADAPLLLEQPLVSLVMTRGAAPLPLTGIEAKRLDKLKQETELAAGAVQSGGKWKVNLLEQDGEAATLASYDALRTAGYDVRILPLAKGKYRLRIIQLPSRAGAEALADDLRGKMGIVAPAVSR